MRFASRQDAGRELGCHLRERGVKVDFVAGLPRGGVIVAAEVARIFQCPLDVLLVRKIGHPLHREFAVGALAESGVVILDQEVIGHKPLLRAELDKVIKEEAGRLQQYEARFRQGKRPDWEDKVVVLVDDGLATGATAEAAVMSARHRGARETIIAAPVASPTAIERLNRVADVVIVCFADPGFNAVGQYYEKFPQTTDDEVLEALKTKRATPRK
jgi:putative phosphoribosyl transferase